MPRIAVISPYYKEPLEVLAQCHRSVLGQTLAADHFMVADGFPHGALADWNVRHVVLPGAHGRGGSTARGIGGTLAEAQGYDFVAYLDADNWFHPEHLASLVELHRSTGAAVCTSLRTFHTPQGQDLGITEPAEDALHHVDTSCFMVHRSAFELLPVWTQLPEPLGLLCDRVFLAAVRHRRFAAASTRQRTVAYRTLYETHYASAGMAPPPGFKAANVLQPALDWLRTSEGVEESVRRLGFWPLAYLRF